MIGPKLVARQLGHPVFALLCAATFGCLALVLGGNALDEAQRFAVSGDPAAITDRALDRVFSQGVAEREIRAALTTGDVELAQSFLDLAGDRGVSVDPVLSEKVKDARSEAASATHTAGRFVQGLWTGEPNDAASLAGTAVGDLFVFGDIRDAAREGKRYLLGEPADPWILGLAGVGIAITAATYASVGLGAPERIGLTLAKIARRTKRLNPALAVRVARDAVKVEKAGGLTELVGDVGRIESKAGTQTALDGLQIAQEPHEVSLLARLSAAKGGKTRAIIKLLGRSAILLSVSALDLATWVLWAALMLFGFASSCKTATERAMLRYIRWRKDRRLRAMTPKEPITA
jgi:hypothetical protein